MKKIFFISIIFAALIVSVPLFAAFESFVINVSASVDDALTVSPSLLEYGMVFPQQEIDKFINVGLSQSFQNEPTADEVLYVIKQKPKCGLPIPDTQPVQYSAFGRATEDGQGNFICPQGYIRLPMLCPYLSKYDNDPQDQNDEAGISAFHGTLLNWDINTTNSTQVGGKLSKTGNDLEDSWKIDLKVPCFKDECSQDWDSFVKKANPSAIPADFVQPQTNKKQMLGCDLWIEVTKINNNTKTFCGDGIKQTPNQTGTGGPNNDGNEACDGIDGVTQGFTCSASCVLVPISQCTIGNTLSCNTGLLGICAAGTQTCVEPGTWGSCVQNQQPIAENCSNGIDDDCDGFTDRNDTDCQQTCFDKTDVMLVLDRSNSIDAGEMASLKSAAHSFVTALNPTTVGNHIGQTNFSTYGHFDLHLTGNKTLVDNAINSLVSGAFTNLMEGISYASGELADTNIVYERPAVPDFMIIITDGNPNRPVNSTIARVQAKAAADSAKAAGVTIYVVGVGSDVDATYLKTIASGNDHYYPVANYASLADTLAQIANCR